MVRPIDIADNLAKTPVAEKVTKVDKAAPELDQRQFAAQLEKQQVSKQQQATPTPKTDEVIIHREKPKQEEKNKKKKQDKKKKSDVHLDLKA